MASDTLKPGLIYADLSREILGIAFTIHNQLGPGFSEEFYEQAYIYELEERGIPYERQKVVNVSYKGRPLGIYRLDLVIEGKIIVELKATGQMNELYKKQLYSYLKATGLEVGYVINFGTLRVQHERMVCTK